MNEPMEASLGYRVTLPLFEGPLDLLLHLIKKEDLDIHDIPISQILNQYLGYLELARELNIDLAGEFLEMAAELTYLKSKLLLPEPPQEEEETDPRADLVAKLIEYQRYKLAAGRLLEKPLLGREVFRRQPLEESSEEAMLEADTLSLLSAFEGLLKRLPREQSHEIRGDRVGVAERVMELMEKLRGRSQAVFESLFETDRTREEMVVTFLALLEMARQRLIRVIQEDRNGTIVVCPLFGN